MTSGPTRKRVRNYVVKCPICDKHAVFEAYGVCIGCRDRIIAEEHTTPWEALASAADHARRITQAFNTKRINKLKMSIQRLENRIKRMKNNEEASITTDERH